VITEITNKNAETDGSILPILSISHLKWIARGIIASVWAYHGVYSKLMLGDPAYLDVIESLPFVNPAFALIPLAWIGLLETCLAVWVLSGLAPRRASWVQTLLLLGMNTGGLLWERESICDPVAMIAQNIAFLALIWMSAIWLEGNRHDHAYARIR